MPRKRKGFEINGIVLLNKPKGISSNQALQKVKHLFHAAKAGHSGNLDPMATGMLPICFGRGTKLCEYMLESNKTYIATLKLGEKTNTGDAEGDTIETKPIPDFSEAELLSVLESFTGKISQIPPMYSALKHEGKCLYELARAGKHIEREARDVFVYEISLENCDDTQNAVNPSMGARARTSCSRSFEYSSQFSSISNSSITIKVTCSKGTYIRTLAEDIAEKLGTVAHLTALHRTECAGFKESEMHTLEELSGEQTEILPITTALQDYPAIEISADDVTTLLHGKHLDITPLLSNIPADTKRVKLMHGSQFVAVADIGDQKILSRKIIG